MQQFIVLFTLFLSFFFLHSIDARSFGAKELFVDKRVSNTKQRFSLVAELKKNHKRNGPGALARAYGRYGATSTLGKGPQARNNIAARKAGRVTAASRGSDSEYICTVVVGGQKMRLAFDSGSADLWVFSDQITTDTDGHRLYSSLKSKTYNVMTGSTWYLTYADGTYAGGIVGTETISAGSSVVSGQAFGVAQTVSDGYTEDYNTDGLLGLAFGSINSIKPNPQPTFFENLLPSLRSKIFTAYLKHLVPGSYDFGYIDKSKYTGPLRYAKVDPSGGYWQVFNQAYAFGGNNYTEAGTSGVLDTGTSLLLLSDDAVSNYWDTVPSASYSDDEGGYVYNCVDNLPDFQLQFGRGTSAFWITIPGELMNYGYLNTDGTLCFGGLQSRGSSNLNILGDIFFKATYVVFDKGKVRAGIAQQA